MTSSLVGSENVYKRQATKRKRPTYLFVRGLPHTTEEVSELLNKNPVSYTHLTLPTICSV
eukprot:7905055-Prorocentrum_lima.AAC.1